MSSFGTTKNHGLETVSCSSLVGCYPSDMPHYAADGRRILDLRLASPDWFSTL